MNLPDDAPERSVTVIRTEYDDGYAQLDLAEGRQPPEEGLAVLSLPCPGRRIRGGIGGQAMTACSWCGEIMASTAGPHTPDGRYPKVVVVTSVGDGLVFWRPFALHLAVRWTIGGGA